MRTVTREAALTAAVEYALSIDTEPSSLGVDQGGAP